MSAAGAAGSSDSWLGVGFSVLASLPALCLRPLVVKVLKRMTPLVICAVPEPPGGYLIDLDSQLVTVPLVGGGTQRAVILGLFQSQLAPRTSQPHSQTYGFRSMLDWEATLGEFERNATGIIWIPGGAADESPDSLTAWSAQTQAIVSGLPLRKQKRGCRAHGGRAKSEIVDEEENSEDEKESDDDKVSFAQVFDRGPLSQPSHRKDKRRKVHNQQTADVEPDAGIAGAVGRLEIVKQLRALKSECRSSASQESNSSASFSGSGGDGRNKLRSFKGLHRLLKSERKRHKRTVRHFCDVAQTALGVIAEYRKLLKELRSQNTLLRQGAPSNFGEEIEETEVDGDRRGAG